MIQEKIMEVHKSLNEFARADIKEFRIMVFVQLCILSGIIIRPSPTLRELPYPSKDRASYAHLKDADIPPEMFDSAMDLVAHCLQMPVWHRDEMETILCESRPDRDCKKWDVFIRGQNLYLLDDKGRVLVKQYGSKRWIFV